MHLAFIDHEATHRPKHMTKELKQAEWTAFFSELNHELADWETVVHILDGENGAQVLSEGLAFQGLTLGEVSGKPAVVLMTGADGMGSHQSHNIFEPRKVAFAERGRGPAGTLDIEDADGITTLITFTRPCRAIAERGRTDLLAA
jgi:hypothetical protein